MAAPGFGFSVGDAIAGCQLIMEIKKALIDTHHAAVEFQLTIADLDFFLRILQDLQSLQDTHGADTILQDYAMTCCRPIWEFLDKYRGFEKALVPQIKRVTSLKTRAWKASKQLQWAFRVKEDAANIRREIEPRLNAINLRINLANGRVVGQTLQIVSSTLGISTVSRDALLPTQRVDCVRSDTRMVVARKTAHSDHGAEPKPLFHITFGSVKIAIGQDAVVSDENLELLVVLMMWVWSMSSHKC